MKLFQESLTTLEQSTLPEQLTQMDKATILQELARHVGDTGSRQEALDLLNLSRELFQLRKYRSISVNQLNRAYNHLLRPGETKTCMF